MHFIDYLCILAIYLQKECYICLVNSPQVYYCQN